MKMVGIKKNLVKFFIKSLFYKFYLRYRYKIKPYESAVIELTDKCNLECSYCPKGYGIGIGNSFLDIDKFKSIFDKLNKDLNLKELILVGFGEPLLYKNMVFALEYVYSKNKNIYTYLTTNGILYTASIAKKLSDAGLRQITISLNFVDQESYLKYNKSDFFERVFNNLKEVSKLENMKTRIIIQLLDLPANKNRIDEYKKLIENEWGFEFQLQPFVNWGGQLDSDELLNIQNERNNIKRYPCAQIERSLIIQTDGSVRACCIAMPINAKHLTIGNITEVDSVYEIINGEKLKKLKDKNMKTCLSDFPTCDKCDAWKNIPNIYLKINNKWH